MLKKRNLFDNPISKLFSSILIINLLFICCYRNDKMVMLISFVSIACICLYYFYIVTTKNLFLKKDFYNGILGLYEAFHCSTIVSYRIGKTPIRIFSILVIILLILGIIILLLELLLKNKKDFSKKRLSAGAIFPVGFIGIFLHRIIISQGFKYSLELIILLFAFCFIFLYISIIKYKNEKAYNYETKD